MNKKLAKRIYKFLDKYAAIKADYDPDFEEDTDKYASPDATMLRICADRLAAGLSLKTLRCWSEWGSGGYRPYASKEGRAEHDDLVLQIQKLIKE